MFTGSEPLWSDLALDTIRIWFNLVFKKGDNVHCSDRMPWNVYFMRWEWEVSELYTDSIRFEC